MSGAERMVSTRWTAVLCFVSHYPVHGPLTTHYPSLSQKQICSFPHGPFCVTHHCSPVINQFINTDFFVREMVVMSSSCLTMVVTFSRGLTCFAYVSPLIPNLFAVGGQCGSRCTYWGHGACVSWIFDIPVPDALEKEVSTSMAEKTICSRNMGGHGENIWELGALQGEEGKEEQRLWPK